MVCLFILRTCLILSIVFGQRVPAWHSRSCWRLWNLATHSWNFAMSASEVDMGLKFSPRSLSRPSLCVGGVVWSVRGEAWCVRSVVWYVCRVIRMWGVWWDMCERVVWCVYKVECVVCAGRKWNMMCVLYVMCAEGVMFRVIDDDYRVRWISDKWSVITCA